MSIVKNIAANGKFDPNADSAKYGAPCVFLSGLYDYFNFHVDDFHGEPGMTWNGPCVIYLSKNQELESHRKVHHRPKRFILPVHQAFRVIKVPHDSIQRRLGRRRTIHRHHQEPHKTQPLRKLPLVYFFVIQSTPWFVNDQHAGFIQLYSGVSFITVKGASHMVPQSKRAEGFTIFHAALTSQGSQEEFKKIILG